MKHHTYFTNMNNNNSKIMQLAPNHIKLREIKLFMMVLKRVHNSMTILPPTVNSPLPEYRLT